MRTRISRGARIAVCGGAGILAAVVTALVGPLWLVPLVAWDVSAGLLLVWTWRLLWPLDGTQTLAHATSESPGRVNTDLLLLSGSVASLLAVGLVLVRAAQEAGLDKGLLVGLCVLSIVTGWATVHTVYTLRYARLYHEDKRRAVDFNDNEVPCYADFAYLALTIGMTFQVSDTDLRTPGVRRLALRHAVLSYMFGTLIIATTINFVAGLGQ